jgi:phosphatidylglycerophosphate synthase
MLTAANGLTFSRLILLPVVIFGIVTRRGEVAAIAMLVTWVTDLLDGRIARRLGQASPFGKTLDSTVDFVLIYSIFITFYQFAILYLGMRTTLCIQFALTAAGRGDEVAAGALAKVTGALEYAYILFLVALEVVPSRPPLPLINTVFFAALAISILLNSIHSLLRIPGVARSLPKT